MASKSPTQRPLKLTRPEPKEGQVLATVLRVLELHPKVAQVWRVNSGAGNLVRKGGYSQWIRFGFKGCPDIHGYLKDGRALFCEVKKPSGKVSDEQVAFLEQAKQAGCVAFVARSAEDVAAALGN